MNTKSNDEEKPGLTKADHAVPGVTIHASSKITYLLPYYHLLGGELHRPDGREENEVLVLEFALYTVRMKGTGLNAVCNFIQRHRARSVAPSSKEEANAETNILEIEVVYRDTKATP